MKDVEMVNGNLVIQGKSVMQTIMESNKKFHDYIERNGIILNKADRRKLLAFLRSKGTDIYNDAFIELNINDLLEISLKNLLEKSKHG